MMGVNSKKKQQLKQCIMQLALIKAPVFT